MPRIGIAGKKGSRAVRDIVRNTSVVRYNKYHKNVDCIVNYGLAGTRLDRFFRLNPGARKIHMINRQVGFSKLSVISKADKKGIQVPESKLSLGRSDNPEDFIEKRTNSIGGIGIRPARRKGRIEGKYYQRFIEDRKYELRVHAFKWIDTSDWSVQKRTGPSDEIAWNYKQGGMFSTVRNPDAYRVFTEAKEVADQILDLLNMSFGAVDFLVTDDNEVLFIEINSAPGFTEYSEHIYYNAFEALTDMPVRELRRMG